MCLDKRNSVLHQSSMDSLQTFIVKLGTYTGKAPTYNSLKVYMYKGTMFFLPLPLDKTLQTIEDVENSKNTDIVALWQSCTSWKTFKLEGTVAKRGQYSSS